MTSTDALAEALTRVVRGTPGVKTVYASGPSIPRLISQTVDAVRGQESTAYVDAGADGVSIAVRIGVGSAESAQETCRRVYESVASYLEGHGDAALKEIRVTVGSIG